MIYHFTRNCIGRGNWQNDRDVNQLDPRRAVKTFGLKNNKRPQATSRSAQRQLRNTLTAGISDMLNAMHGSNSEAYAMA